MKYYVVIGETEFYYRLELQFAQQTLSQKD